MVLTKNIYDGADFDQLVTEIENEYKGSEQKKTVIDSLGNKYLLKVPDPTREEALKKTEPFIHNVESEYVACKIAKSLGLPIQDVFIGQIESEDRGGKVLACLCKDLRSKNERLVNLENIRLSYLGDDELLEPERLSFESVEEIIRKSVSMDFAQQEDFLNFYAEVFVLDALIGNTDRHNENIGLITDAEGNYLRPALFDCGSSLRRSSPCRSYLRPKNFLKKSASLFTTAFFDR